MTELLKLAIVQLLIDAWIKDLYYVCYETCYSRYESIFVILTSEKHKYLLSAFSWKKRSASGLMFKGQELFANTLMV